MYKKLEATVIDSDYAYIQTFIDFLKQILDMIINAWNSLMGSLGTEE